MCWPHVESRYCPARFHIAPNRSEPIRSGDYPQVSSQGLT